MFPADRAAETCGLSPTYDGASAVTALSHLECARCRRTYEPGRAYNLCQCGGPLLCRYDLDKARQGWSREWLSHAPNTMWRYTPVLPVSKPAALVSLGEGMTPLAPAQRFGAGLGLEDLWIKNEGLNPTGSFKARGLSCAVSMAVELGITVAAVASTGNAASALAAYAAAAGIKAKVFLPRDVSQASFVECKSLGAEVTLVDGLIGDCARLVAEGVAANGWFDMGALKEPYRVEGKKTMGYELAEQFRWELPDAIVYPTGGGVGLIGMWKAFEEMERLGWISSKRPKMIAVQPQGCRPVVDAFERGAENCRDWDNAWTIATGLKVPKPLGDFLILKVLRDSTGSAVAVSDADMLDAGIRFAREEGLLLGIEGSACLAALPRLLADGILSREQRIVVFNTSSGLKYLDTYATRFARVEASEQDKLGGLVTPR